MQSNRLMRSSMNMTTAERAFDPFSFVQRHIGPRADDLQRMLQVVGAPSLDGLMDEAIPGDIRQTQPLDFGPALSEPELLAKMRAVASRNHAMVSLIGQGYYGTHLPPVIQRNVLENPAWYTAYTPYQAEISQGRLEALINFQTMIADLTGLEIANASLLDEATAAAEAMAMARRVSASQANAFFVDRDCHPQTIAVIQMRAEPLGWDAVVGDPATDLDPATVFGAILQYPGSSGTIRDYRGVIERLHATDAAAIIAADPLALTLLMSPGELGADIAIGSAQRFGVPMGYGGPHAAFIAARSGFQRALPGRIVGISVTAVDDQLTVWRCRPASNTSGAKRRPQTSALLRYCRRSSQRCTVSITGQMGFVKSLRGWHIWPRPWRAACKITVGTSLRRNTLTRSRFRLARGKFLSRRWHEASICEGWGRIWQSAVTKRRVRKLSRAFGLLSVRGNSARTNGLEPFAAVSARGKRFYSRRTQPHSVPS